MKESKDTPAKANQDTPSRWNHRGSVSSHRSVRSNHSQDSHKSPKTRSSKSRPRRFSLSSMHSQAVSVNSSSSAGTNNLSRKTSHADDSDASDTNESLGETEEDVWFPTDARNNGDINVDELDQLLNLSEEEEFEPNPYSSSRYGGKLDTEIKRIVEESAARPQKIDSSPESTRHTSAARRKNSSASSRYNVARPIPEEQSRENTSDSSNQKQQDPLLESPSPPDPAPTGSPTPRKFVEYRPSEKFDQPNLDAGTSSSSGSSENKMDPRFGKVISGEKVVNDAKDATVSDLTNGTDDENREDDDTPDAYDEHEPIRKRVSDPHVSLERENPGVVVDDQQSQRYSFFAPGLENTIHAPDLASLVGESNSFSSLFNPENGTWFLDCFRPTDLEMKAISRAFGIHPLTTEDVQTEDAREKYETFKNYYLVVYHTFENDKEDANYMEAINFYVLVFREGVISFHFEPVSHCRNVRRRMRQLRDYLSFSSDWIAYALIDDITDSFAPEIESVEKEADFIEDAVYLDHDGSIEMSTLLRRLGESRRHTMHLLRMLSGKADVVRGFAKRVNERNMPSEMNLYLGDIQDHIVTMYQNLSAYEKIFSRTHFNYMGLLQMEFVDSSNRMTGVLGKVTILGTVLLPMNLITGLFGMNVKVPGQEVENLRWFFGILALVLFLIITLLCGSALYVKFSINRRNPSRVSN